MKTNKKIKLKNILKKYEPIVKMDYKIEVMLDNGDIHTLNNEKDVENISWEIKELNNNIEQITILDGDKIIAEIKENEINVYKQKVYEYDKNLMYFLFKTFNLDKSNNAMKLEVFNF